MESTRRGSVSELNLEELLLAMADSDSIHQESRNSYIEYEANIPNIDSVSNSTPIYNNNIILNSIDNYSSRNQGKTSKPLPTPTPRSKNKNKEKEPSPRPLSLPIQMDNSEYYNKVLYSNYNGNQGLNGDMSYGYNDQREYIGYDYNYNYNYGVMGYVDEEGKLIMTAEQNNDNNYNNYLERHNNVTGYENYNNYAEYPVELQQQIHLQSYSINQQQQQQQTYLYYPESYLPQIQMNNDNLNEINYASYNYDNNSNLLPISNYPYQDYTYIYNYGYLTEPGYNLQYYQTSPTFVESNLSSNCATPSKPLPRLPSKKNKFKKDDNNYHLEDELNKPVLGHDLTFGTPPIASSHHLGLFPHISDSPLNSRDSIERVKEEEEEEKKEEEKDNNINNLKDNEDQEDNEYEDELLDLEEADSHSNLVSLLQDITLKIETPIAPPKRTTISDNNDLKEFEEKPKSNTIHPISNTKEKDLDSNNFNKLRQDSNNSNFTNTLASPVPPPRLSKEKATARLSESYARSPRPFFTVGVQAQPNNGKSNKDKGISNHLFTPAKSSPLHSTKEKAMGERTGLMKMMTNKNKDKVESLEKKILKRNSTKVGIPSKPNNCIMVVSGSNPVIDPDADGFDFDESDFENIDQRIQKLTVSFKEIKFESLVKDFIIKDCKYDWQKIRAIFLWIALNIKFELPNDDIIDSDSDDDNNNKSDSDSYSDSDSEEEDNNNSKNDSSNNISSDEDNKKNKELNYYSESAKSVMIRGSAYQLGFANLFKAMATLAGVECEIVEGYLKDPLNCEDLSKEPKVNHAWNSVKIQGYYRLIDSGLATATHQFNIHHKLDLFYFLTNPTKMIFTHYPIKSQQQYLSPIIPYHCFTLLPFATSHFFDLGIKILDLPDGLFTIHEDSTGELNLSIPEGALCSGEIETGQPNPKKLNALVQCKSRETGRYAKILMRFKGRAERGLLKIQCGYPLNNNLISNLPYLFTLRLGHTGNKPPEEFVKLLPSPESFVIVTPVNFDLLYNIHYRFHVIPSKFEAQHYKLALRSPTMKTHKFVYYPGDQGYVANVTLRERGQWAISYMVKGKERPSKRDPWFNVACYRCI